MDRRGFLIAGGLAGASPVLAQGFQTVEAPGPQQPPLTRVDLVSDGLGLDPREYAAVLAEVAGQPGFEADYYSNGGAITALEQQFARLLGKQLAMFVPTGTLANHLAVRTLAGAGRRVLVQAESHLYNDSGDGAQTLGGLNLVPLGENRSTITLAEVQAWVERSRHGRVPTQVGAISIENPVRRRDHDHVDDIELDKVCRYARENGIGLHLDGARLFNLPHHTGRSVRDYAALFDSVYVSLWKHFNAASGAILAGDASFIEGLFHVRRMFGGSLPHAWPQAAPAMSYAEGYEADYARAWQAADRLIEMLQADGRFIARRIPNGTSKFFLTVPGQNAELLVRGLATRGVVLQRGTSASGEIGVQVNATLLRRTPQALARDFVDALDG